MNFENSVEPQGSYMLCRLIPLTRTAGGLHVPTKGDAQEKGGRIYVVKCGPLAEGFAPGARIICSPNWQPVALTKLDGIESNDGTYLFLFPADQVIAIIREDIAEAVALVTES